MNHHTMKNKYFIALVILIIMAIIALAISSCSTCPPASQITNGRAAQRHDMKKFGAFQQGALQQRTFRATYSKYGSLYVITYKNMQEERKVIVDCKPQFKNGSWIVIADEPKTTKP